MKDQEEKYVLSLESLLDISILLNSELDFTKVIQSSILTCLGQVTGKYGAVYIKKPLAEDYELACQKGLDEKISGELSSFALRSEDSLIELTQSRQDPFIYVKGTSSLIDKLDPALILPLTAKDRSVGFMILGPKYFGGYGQEDLDFLKKFAIITANAIENSLLYSLATRDTKTGLYLHHYFVSRLKEEIYGFRRYQERFSLVMIDLDHFKKVNDTYGHSAGDFVLEQMGRIILDFVRISDLPCRFGGEEFAVILPSTAEPGACHFADRLREAIQNSVFQFKNQVIPITASFGVAEYVSGSSVEEMVEHADKALYLAKEMGRNQVQSYSDYLREKE